MEAVRLCRGGWGAAGRFWREKPRGSSPWGGSMERVWGGWSPRGGGHGGTPVLPLEPPLPWPGALKLFPGEVAGAARVGGPHLGFQVLGVRLVGRGGKRGPKIAPGSWNKDSRVLGGPENRPPRSLCRSGLVFSCQGPGHLGQHVGSAAVSPAPQELRGLPSAAGGGVLPTQERRLSRQGQPLHVPAGPARPALPVGPAGRRPLPGRTRDPAPRAAQVNVGCGVLPKGQWCQGVTPQAPSQGLVGMAAERGWGLLPWHHAECRWPCAWSSRSAQVPGRVRAAPSQAGNPESSRQVTIQGGERIGT